MALSISKDKVFTTYEIPLVSGVDEKWTDNSWIIEHLRHLADKIESEKPNIYNIGIKSSAQYKCPILFIDCFDNKEKE